ncbi:MAG: DUF1624 domain-containing protein [Rhodobacter sp.]|nr:DUF1624 domain-containing protein [Paracoccaceae bacterium]MCC0075492.1 DUF1624 domain-containing protein [Rhodobacter sp.]
MVAFHLTFDLGFFGFIPPDTVMQPFWMVFARLVAGSFVVLAGVSLVLAHGNGLRGRAFVRGTATVALAAVLVTAATLVAIPQGWVFFGILHMIALGRVLGLPFLRAPAWLLVIAGVAIWAAPYLWQSAVFDSRALAWVGFAVTQPLSMDLEPVFPWFGPFLLGMAAARLGLLPTRGIPGPAGRALAWAGRHSLAIYLIHQPVLLGTLWLITTVLKG